MRRVWIGRFVAVIVVERISEVRYWARSKSTVGRFAFMGQTAALSMVFGWSLVVNAPGHDSLRPLVMVSMKLKSLDAAWFNKRRRVEGWRLRR